MHIRSLRLYNLQQKVYPIHCSPCLAWATMYILIRQSIVNETAVLPVWSYKWGPCTVSARVITIDTSVHYGCNNKRHNYIMFIAINFSRSNRTEVSLPFRSRKDCRNPFRSLTFLSSLSCGAAQARLVKHRITPMHTMIFIADILWFSWWLSFRDLTVVWQTTAACSYA